MKQSNLVQSATGDPANPNPPFDYAAAAAEVNQALDTIARIVPKFQAAQENSTTYVRLRRNIPLPLVEKAIATAQQHQELQPLFDAVDARDVLTFQQYFRPIQDRLKAAERDLGFSLDARLMEVGRMVRKFYAVTKSVLAWTAGMETLASHVDGMKVNVQQTKRQLSPQKAAELAERRATREQAKATKAAQKAAEKAAKAQPNLKKPPVVIPGPM
jgi:hypothetical protein